MDILDPLTASFNSKVGKHRSDFSAVELGQTTGTSVFAGHYEFDEYNFCTSFIPYPTTMKEE